MSKSKKERKTRVSRRQLVVGTVAGAAAPTGISPHPSTLKMIVNGRVCELMIGRDVRVYDTLAYTLRETLGLTGTKIACNEGACGACTVLINGRPIASCMTLTTDCDGASITTIEGLQDPNTMKLSPLQQAFVDNSAFQCGFCTPGIIMSSKALLDANPNPTEQDVKEALAGNFCRCISHYQVIKAVMEAAAAGKTV